MLSRFQVCSLLAALALAGLMSGAACSSSGTTGSTSTGAGGGSSGTGGPVTGPADTHCGAKVQPVSATACHPTEGVGGGSGTSTSSSTGAGGAVSEYGDTLPNSEADDDDCKYHLSWTASSIGENSDVTFTAVITTKSDGKPVPAGDVDIEAYLNDTHPAPNSDATTTESPTGTYAVGPIRFDAAGKWTVRFHIHEDCSDLTEDSPHGHVAFFVNVP